MAGCDGCGGSPAASRGSALLLVIGATAGLSVLASMLLLASLTAYETAAIRHERAQAQALAEGVLLQLRNALAAGEPVPAPAFPEAPPGAGWPERSDAPEAGAAGGFGVALEVWPRVDPDGNAVPGAEPDTWLLQARVTAWFRRGVVQLERTLVARAGEV